MFYLLGIPSTDQDRGTKGSRTAWALRSREFRGQTQEPVWRRDPPPRLKESQSLPVGKSCLLRTSLIPIFTAPSTSHRYIAGQLSVRKLSACSTQTYKGAQIVQSRSVSFSFFTYNLASLKVQSWLGPAAPPGGGGLHLRSPPPGHTPALLLPDRSFLYSAKTRCTHT